MKGTSSTGRRNVGISQSPEMPSREVKCYNCHKRRHIARQCPNLGITQKTVRAVSATITSSESNVTENSATAVDEVASEQMWKWTRVLSTSNSEDQNQSSNSWAHVQGKCHCKWHKDSCTVGPWLTSYYSTSPTAAHDKGKAAMVKGYLCQ